MIKPKISIITITYNSGSTLEETIKSIVSQNYSNLEYLIIDGGSTDRTLDIIEKYRDKIDFIISEPDNGISDAFNKGIKYATGDIIGIINSDDLLLPKALDRLSKEYTSDVGVYRGHTIVWNDKTGSMTSMKPSMKFSLYSFKRLNVCHPSTFISKHIYENFGGYNINYKYRMDFDLLMRLYNKGVRFKYLNNDLALFRLGGTTTNTYKKKISEVYQIYINNGANTVLACMHIMTFVIYEEVKHLLSVIFKADTLRKLKYE